MSRFPISKNRPRGARQAIPFAIASPESELSTTSTPRPRVSVRILQLDARRLEAELPSGAHKTYTVSSNVEQEPGIGAGDRAELVLSPLETEVYVIRSD